MSSVTFIPVRARRRRHWVPEDSRNTVAFNQPFGDWYVPSVMSMDNMFRDAKAFDQPIGDWYTSSTTDMFSGFVLCCRYHMLCCFVVCMASLIAVSVMALLVPEFVGATSSVLQDAILIE